jgi:hypothetical protein
VARARSGASIDTRSSGDSGLTGPVQITSCSSMMPMAIEKADKGRHSHTTLSVGGASSGQVSSETSYLGQSRSPSMSSARTIATATSMSPMNIGCESVSGKMSELDSVSDAGTMQPSSSMLEGGLGALVTSEEAKHAPEDGGGLSQPFAPAQASRDKSSEMTEKSGVQSDL